MGITSLQQLFYSPRVRAFIGVTLLAALGAFHIFFVLGNLTTTFDDAYMFARYAGNVLHGQGIAWNPDGVQTYGATSLLYLGVIVLIRGIFSYSDVSSILVLTSAVLGLSALAIMVFGLNRISTGFIKSHPFMVPLLLAFVFFLSPAYLFHATSGMDTTLALLCNTLLIFAALNWGKHNSPGSLALLVLAAYASFLARPDNIFYSTVFPMLYGLFFFQHDRFKKVIWFGAAFVGILMLDTVVKSLIFGDPLPLPFYAKTMGYDEGYAGVARWNPISYLFDFFEMVLPFVLVLVFSASRQMRLFIVAFFVPVLLTFVYYFSVMQIMGFGARYYFPAVPFFVIGSLLLFDHMLQFVSLAMLFKQPRRIFFSLTVGVVLFLPAVRASVESFYERTFLSEAPVVQVSVSKLPELGWWQTIDAVSAICEKLPTQTKVGMTEYGLVGARAAQVIIIDPLGLHDPFFAHHGFSSTEFLNRQPDLIWFPHPDYVTITTSIQGDSQFWRDYEYFPGAFDYGLAIRKDARDYILIVDIVREVWGNTYPGLDMADFLASPP